MCFEYSSSETEYAGRKCQELGPRKLPEFNNFTKK